MIFILLYILATLFLVGLYAWFIRGLKSSYSFTSARDPVSVIIASRNAATSLPALLESLKDQTYPPEKTEVIVINDRSTDSTVEILQQWKEELPYLRWKTISSLPENVISPKKFALQTGIRDSCHEFLLFTDADCVPVKSWIERMAAAFTEADMIVAPAPLLSAQKDSPPLWQKLVSAESWFLQLINHAAITNNFPLSCTGRNFAYRKTIFEQLDGFESIARSLSGDDDLFLMQAAKSKRVRIFSLLDPEALVFSQTPKTFWDYLRQKQRHHSSGRYIPLNRKLFYSAWYGMEILLTFSFFAGLLGILPSFSTLSVCFLTKSALELAFFGLGLRKVNHKIPLLQQLLFLVWFPVFSLANGVPGIVKKPTWT